MILHTRTCSSPVGELLLLATDTALVGLEFVDAGERPRTLLRTLERHLGAFESRPHPDPAGAASRLGRYFTGELAALDEQPVEPHGTEFQLAVWRALRTIRPGTTLAYHELAATIGRPEAMRAVGAANGANPIALFVPCHRVIAANHTLWGYGGGLERKRWLLAHEGAPFADRWSQEALPIAGN